MLMYTSCGWFFDDISGIETVQVIQYAGRVLQLARELFEDGERHIFHPGRLPRQAAEDEEGIEDGFLRLLADARSNLPEFRDGASVYERFVRPAFVDLYKVGAHYAISSLFQNYGNITQIYCYTVLRVDHRQLDTGRFRMVIGRALLVSDITQESGHLTYGVLHFGDHNIHGGVREYRGEQEYQRLVTEATQAFSRADIPDVIRAFDRGFGTDTYSLKSLFRDEQRNTLSRILSDTLEEAESVYRQLYENHAPLMRFLSDLKTPLPKAFQTTAQYALNSHLRRAFASEELDVGRIRTLLDEAANGGFELDSTTLEFTMRHTLEQLAFRVQQDPASVSDLHAFSQAVALATTLPFSVNMWTVQNIGYELMREIYPAMLDSALQWRPGGAGVDT